MNFLYGSDLALVVKEKSDANNEQKKSLHNPKKERIHRKVKHEQWDGEQQRYLRPSSAGGEKIHSRPLLN